MTGRHDPSVVYRAAVANRLHDDDAVLGVQFTNDALVSHAIAPQAEFVVSQGLTEPSRIVRCDPAVHIVQNICCRRAADLL